MADYLQTDYVVNLEPYIAGDPNAGMTDYEDILKGCGRRTPAMPRRVSPLPNPILPGGALLQQDAFCRARISVPTTRDELVETCRAIRDITGAPAFWLGQPGRQLYDPVAPKTAAATPTRTAICTLPPRTATLPLKVLQMWQDNVNEGIWRTAGRISSSGPLANEMIPHVYRRQRGGQLYPRQKIPSWTGEPPLVPQVSEDTAANLSAGHVIIALNQDGNQDRMYAAYEFIKFMTSHDANLAVAAGNTGYLPIRQSVAGGPGL